MKDITFSNSINNIIKYKNGDCFYILTQITTSAHMYSKITHVPRYYPMIYFKHSTASSMYNHVFTDGQLFSDKFELVKWKDIPIPKRREIVQLNGFNDQVGFKYQNIVKPNISNEAIDRLVQEIGEKGGTYKPLNNAMVNDYISAASNVGFINIKADDAASNGVWCESASTTVGITYNPCGEQEMIKTHEDEIDPVVFRSKKEKTTMVRMKEEKAIIIK